MYGSSMVNGASCAWPTTGYSSEVASHPGSFDGRQGHVRILVVHLSDQKEIFIHAVCFKNISIIKVKCDNSRFSKLDYLDVSSLVLEVDPSVRVAPDENGEEQSGKSRRQQHYDQTEEATVADGDQSRVVRSVKKDKNVKRVQE